MIECTCENCGGRERCKVILDPGKNSCRFWKAETVKHGRWIYRSDDAASCYCSECNEEALTAPYERNCIESDFCPNCGARMDAKPESEVQEDADM